MQYINLENFRVNFRAQRQRVNSREYINFRTKKRTVMYGLVFKYKKFRDKKIEWIRSLRGERPKSRFSSLCRELRYQLGDPGVKFLRVVCISTLQDTFDSWSQWLKSWECVRRVFKGGSLWLSIHSKLLSSPPPCSLFLFTAFCFNATGWNITILNSRQSARIDQATGSQQSQNVRALST